MPTTAVAVLCCLIVSIRAEAQLTSSCLRPFAIPDKWIENQTPPLDGSDTFDVAAPTPDAYVAELGYNPAEDDGKFLSVTAGNPGSSDPPNLAMSFPVRLPDPAGDYSSGSADYVSNVRSCAGGRVAIGDVLPLETGAMLGPTVQGINDLIAMDPAARWDPVSRMVVDSAFTQSPRVIQLPVFDAAEYARAQISNDWTWAPGGWRGVRVVKIVGFFVESFDSYFHSIRGYLTAQARLTALPSTARGGESAMLSARLEMAGGTVGGIPIEFQFLGSRAGLVLTNASDQQVSVITPVDGAVAPGTYTAGIRARVSATDAFVNAAESSADFTLLAEPPRITWPDPDPIVYGTPLGSSQLNATASVPGHFFYTPSNGTLLHAGSQVLNVTFVPDDMERYAPVTIGRLITILPAPLMLRVAPASKLYLDPVPAFTLATEGFVNGDTLASLSGSAAFQTSATASSPVGTYEVRASGLSSPDYAIQYQPGTLEVLPRPLATLVYPANGATDFNVTQPFTWTSVPAQAFYLYVGTTPGAKDVVNTGETQQLSYRAKAGVPGGMTLYARMWTKYAGVWLYTDSVFSAPPIARMLFPASGGTIDLMQAITWNTVAAAQAYYLYVGSTVGAKDLVNTGEIQQTSYVLRSTIPTNQVLYARLWTKFGGVWRYSDSTFSVAPLFARLTYPANGTTTFDAGLPAQWTSVANAQAYYLYVGSTPGAKDLVNTGELQETSCLIRTALPINQTLYARMWTKVSGVWRYVDSTFSATATVARFTYPAASGTTLDPAQPLTWTTVPNAQAYYLYVGSTPGAKDLVNSFEIQQTSYLLPSTLPHGQLLYARLWTKLNGVWRYVDTTFLVP